MPTEDYYGKDAGPSANAPDDSGSETPDSTEGDSEDSALVPKSLVGKNAKVGDVCSFKIVHMYDDEAEIQYVKKDDEEEGEADMEHPVDKMARDMGEM